MFKQHENKQKKNRGKLPHRTGNEKSIFMSLLISEHSQPRQLYQKQIPRLFYFPVWRPI